MGGVDDVDRGMNGRFDGAVILEGPTPSPGLRHLTAAPMSESSDPVLEIVASGREVVPDDVVSLWHDLMDGRSTAQQTAARARLLMEAVNATHVASWGLSSLYALAFRGVRKADDVASAFERWRQHVRDYEADPDAWDRSYYQRMIIDFAERHGTERAKALGSKLVASGVLRDADVAAALAGEPGVR
jgi:hypothetical protein